MDINLKIGDQVTFNSDNLDAFNTATDIDNIEIQRYRQLVLAGANQIGVVNGFDGKLVTVSYPDGWQIPIAPQYLILLPKV